MKSSLVLSSLLVTAFAQLDYSSAPFELAIISSNATYNGTILGACHEGAAIEGLCPTGSPIGTNASYSTFYQRAYTDNFTDSQSVLFWDLHFSDNQTAPSAMHFATDWTSNLAIPIIYPSDTETTLVYFDANNHLYLLRYLDSDVDPPAYLDPTQKIEQWYLCTTRYSYLYTTLVWVVGYDVVPKNPSCQKVEIVRSFI